MGQAGNERKLIPLPCAALLLFLHKDLLKRWLLSDYGTIEARNSRFLTPTPSALNQNGRPVALVIVLIRCVEATITELFLGTDLLSAFFS